MKKELFAAALLALILTLSVLNTRAISSVCDRLRDTVARAGDTAESGDWEECQKLMDEVMSLWRSHEGYTSVVLRHTDIETLTDDFYELSEHINTRDAGAVQSAVELVREHLESIKKMESLNLGSIF